MRKIGFYVATMSMAIFGLLVFFSACSNKSEATQEEQRISQSLITQMQQNLQELSDTLRAVDATDTQPITINVFPKVVHSSSLNHMEKDVIVGLATFLFVLLMVFLVLRAKHSNLLARYRVIEHSLDCGRPLPDAFFNEEGMYSRRMKTLTRGFVWLGMGLGVGLFLLLEKETLFALGLVPLFIGIGNLVKYRVITKDEKKHPNYPWPSDDDKQD